MCDFHCDIDPKENADLIHAFHTIFDAISNMQKDSKRSQIHAMGLESELKTMRDAANKSLVTPRTPKRRRTESHYGDIDASVDGNASAHLNTAAIFLSSTCGDDDEVIGSTQVSQSSSPLRANVNRSYRSHKSSANSNKENREHVSLSPNHSHKTVKPTEKRIETSVINVRKSLFDQSEDEANKSKESEHSLNAQWITKKTATPSPAIDANKSMAKKKNRLSLSSSSGISSNSSTSSITAIANAPKLRQATINFTRTNQSNEETYCDEFTPTDVSFAIAHSPDNVSPQEHMRNSLAQINLDKSSPTNSKLSKKKSPSVSNAITLNVPRTEAAILKPNHTSATSQLTIIEDPVSEIITLDDTQCSFQDFDDICTSKYDDKAASTSKPRKLGPFEPPDRHASTPKPAKRNPEDDCPDCLKHKEIIDAIFDVKQREKRYEKCIRHRRGELCPPTPPNYWNPRMPATPEGEHIETPFDYRFLD